MQISPNSSPFFLFLPLFCDFLIKLFNFYNILKTFHIIGSSYKCHDIVGISSKIPWIFITMKFCASQSGIFELSHIIQEPFHSQISNCSKTCLCNKRILLFLYFYLTQERNDFPCHFLKKLKCNLSRKINCSLCSTKQSNGIIDCPKIRIAQNRFFCFFSFG